MEKEKSKKNFLYERTIDEIINHAQCKSSKGDPKTTIYVPIEQDVALKDIQDKYGKSAYCTTRYAAQLGFSLFEYENKDILNQISEIRKKLGHSKNRYVSASLYTLNVELRKDGNHVKRALIIDGNILSAMKKWSNNLNIPVSPFVKILISHALSTTKDRDFIEIREKSREDKIYFKDIVNEILDYFIRLMSGEKEEVEYDMNDIVELEEEGE